MSVIVKDVGWNDYVSQLKKINGAHTKVGFPAEGELAAPRKKGSGAEPVENMSELAQVAAANEFGAPNRNIPERSFVRKSFDENLGRINKIKQDEYNKIVARKTTVKLALARIGEFAAACMRKAIVDTYDPPNSPKTIEAKKSSHPLIDTAQMLQSIQHEEVVE